MNCYGIYLICVIISSIFFLSFSNSIKPFSYEQLITCDKLNLDIFWLKDDSLSNLADLPSPDKIAAEIVDNLEAVLEQFREVVENLPKQTEG